MSDTENESHGTGNGRGEIPSSGGGFAKQPISRRIASSAARSRMGAGDSGQGCEDRVTPYTIIGKSKTGQDLVRFCEICGNIIELNQLYCDVCRDTYIRISRRNSNIHTDQVELAV